MADDLVASDAGALPHIAVRWPYIVGLISIVLGVAGLVLTPISGLVYVSLPGVTFAAYHALASRSPARIAVAVSAAILAIGLALGAVALYSFLGDNFFVQEWASMAALFAMPIIGVVVGLPALVVACFRPGNRTASRAVGLSG